MAFFSPPPSVAQPGLPTQKAKQPITEDPILIKILPLPLTQKAERCRFLPVFPSHTT